MLGNTGVVVIRLGLGMLMSLLLVSGCAHSPPPAHSVPKPVEVGLTEHTRSPAPKPTAQTQVSSKSRAVADSTIVSSALRGCKGKNLLPGDEMVYEGALEIMGQVRRALQQGDYDEAASRARAARQLVASLSCR